MMLSNLYASSKRFSLGVAFGLGIAGCLASAVPARAISTIPVLYGTGVGVTPTPSPLALDANWKIAQLPNTFIGGSKTPGTGAYLTYDVATPWIGSTGTGGFGDTNDNNGTTINGIQYRWISGSNTEKGLSTNLNPAASGGPPPTPEYSYILQQDFSSTGGLFNVSLNLTADNLASYYIGGTIDLTDARNPTINGGTLIGKKTVNDSLAQTVAISNWVNLVNGTNTAWIVVTDTHAVTGAIASNATFSQDVPGPLPLLGASAAFGWSRRLRRRIGSRRSHQA